MMEGLAEFKVAQKNKHGGRSLGKVRGSYNIYDYFCNYCKTRPKEERYRLDCKEYSDIIHGMNGLLVEELINAGYIDLPYSLGKIFIIGWNVSSKIVNGKLVHPYIVDWDKTLELWYTDPEAMERRIKVYFEFKKRYKISFGIRWSSYKNQSYYKLTINREIKRLVSRNIRENRLVNYFGSGSVWQKKL
jgi:hypothetical protein